MVLEVGGSVGAGRLELSNLQRRPLHLTPDVAMTRGNFDKIELGQLSFEVEVKRIARGVIGGHSESG